MASPDPAPPGPATGSAAPAVDIEAGLARLMGNRVIHQRVLMRFLQDYRDAGVRLRDALGTDDQVLAARLAHTLKGAAGMIDAAVLQASALALEEVLRSRGGALDEALRALEDALDAVLRQLEHLPLARERQAAAADHATSPEIGQRLHALRTLLVAGDGAAVDLVERARPALQESLGEPAYAELSAAVAGFDYERALDVLDRPMRAGA